MADSSNRTEPGRTSHYKKDSFSLPGAVAMGTGVMIGAGVVALTGQIAEQAGAIAMYLKHAYGKGTMTAACSLLMYFSMVINESLVASTFGTYTLQLFDIGKNQWLIPALGVGLLAVAFGVNIAGNRFIDSMSRVTALVKVGRITLFALVGLWLSGLSFESEHSEPAGRTWLAAHLPIADWLPRYSRNDLAGDVTGGIVVAIMLVPQGMAYAMLAS